MTTRISLMLAGLCAAATSLSAATYDATNGYVGAQTVMLPTDANVASADPLIFNVTSGYFNNGNSSRTYSNANVRIDNLTMNNGYSGAVTLFTGTVTGTGNLSQSAAGTAQDFVFAGNMTGYSGNITIANTGSASNTAISNTLGDGTSAIVQFGGATAGGTTALGTVTSVNGRNVISAVSGTGSITAVNLVYNYAAGGYDRLLVANTISAYRLAQTGAATIEYTGNITGRNATVSGNSILVAAGTAVIRGSVASMGAINVAGGTLVTGNAQSLNAAAVNVTSGTLQIGDGVTNQVTLAAGATLTVADGATLKFGASSSTLALNGGSATLGAASGFTLDLGDAFNAAGTYTLLSGGTVTTNAYTLTGFDSTHFTAAFANGTLQVNSVVPEPGTYGLIAAGALAAASLVRRRRIR